MGSNTAKRNRSETDNTSSRRKKPKSSELVSKEDDPDMEQTAPHAEAEPNEQTVQQIPPPEAEPNEQTAQQIPPPEAEPNEQTAQQIPPPEQFHPASEPKETLDSLMEDALFHPASEPKETLDSLMEDALFDDDLEDLLAPSVEETILDYLIEQDLRDANVPEQWKRPNFPEINECLKSVLEKCKHNPPAHDIAKFLGLVYGDDWVYIKEEASWYRFSGHYWILFDQDEHELIIKDDLTQSVEMYAKNVAGFKKFDTYVKDNAPKIIKFCQKIPVFSHAKSPFKKSPFLGFTNGILNLMTMKLEGGKREQYRRRHFDFDWVDEPDDVLIKHLTHIIPNKEVLDFLIIHAFSAVIQDLALPKAFVLHGESDAGKSFLLALLLQTLPKATSANPQLFEKPIALNKPSYDVKRALRFDYVGLSETKEDTIWLGDTIKQFLGEANRIRDGNSNDLGEQLKFSGSVFLGTNWRVLIKDTKGTWFKRVLGVYCPAKFVKTEQELDSNNPNIHLADPFISQQDNIINFRPAFAQFGIRILHTFLTDKKHIDTLSIPEEIYHYTNQMKAQSDMYFLNNPSKKSSSKPPKLEDRCEGFDEKSLVDFVANYCIISPNKKVKRFELCEAIFKKLELPYNRIARNTFQSERTRRIHEHIMKLEDISYSENLSFPGHTTNYIGYVGIMLNEEGNKLLGKRF